jgi:uncharacterized protein YecT (DUF1311 family)
MGAVWTWSSMFFRYSRHLLIPLLLLFGLTPSARAECGDADPIISRLLCHDGELRRLESEIQVAYDSATSRVASADLPFLEAEQSGWLAQRRLICSKRIDPNFTDEKIHKCIASFGTGRIERLKEWPNLGKVTMIDNRPSVETVCAAALDRANLAWYQDNEWGEDRFAPLVPAGTREPAWKVFDAGEHIKQARFDFLNEGVDREVYSIKSDPDWRTKFDWYVVVADGEEKFVRERVTALSTDLLDHLADFGRRLRRQSVEKFPSVEFNDVFGTQGQPASLRSMLIAATNSAFFRGDATTSRVFIHDGATYLIAAGLRGKVVLFESDRTGAIAPLCQHQIVPSLTQLPIEVFDRTFACPAKDDGLAINWQGDQWDMHAAIDLPEWGGRRVVARRQEAAGARYGMTRTYIGALDDPAPPEKNVWEPLDALAPNFESTELVLAQTGPYILVDDWIPIRADSTPPGRTYYRVTDNDLVKVCRLTRQAVPPPEYAVKN